MNKVCTISQEGLPFSVQNPEIPIDLFNIIQSILSKP